MILPVIILILPPTLTQTLQPPGECNITQFPWSVSIAIVEKPNETEFSFGGSLLTPRWILTTATCVNLTLFGTKIVYLSAGSNYKFSFDDDSMDEYSQIRISGYGVVYPGSEELRHDLGLFKAREDFVTNPPYVELAQLPRIGWTKTNCENGQKVSFSGFGSSEIFRRKREVGQMKCLELTIADLETCLKKISSLDVNDVLCTMEYKAGASPCYGDYGSALVCKGRIVGVASTGMGCGIPERSHFYTNVEEHLSWIEKTISLETETAKNLDLTDISMFPFLTRIHFYSHKTESETTCSGILVTKEWVLTAAHCIAPRAQIALAVGSNLELSLKNMFNRTNDPFYQYRFAVKSATHSRYLTKIRFDIALLKAQEPFLIRSPHVELARFPKRTGWTSKAMNQKVLLAGWGISNKTKSLKFEELEIVNEEVCEKNKTRFDLDDSNLCGMDLDEKDCLEDSGAALIFRDVVIGFVSTSEACNVSERGITLMRIEKFTTWIKDITGLKLSYSDVQERKNLRVEVHKPTEI